MGRRRRAQNRKYVNNVIIWENYKNIAFSHKDEPYNILYEKCRLNRDYNFMLLDGALIQMKYEFYRNSLIAHILSFYPHPELEKFQDYPEEYENLYYSNELFSDIIERKTIIFPLRFDFSQEHTELIHPKIHVTLGNYKDCRIPVSKPLSPNKFILFILRNFYFFKFQQTNTDNLIKCNIKFNEEITNKEKKLLYINYE